jgi:LytR cell envelope-related transcriptional attenuator
MSSLLKEVGAVAGIASFLGLALLALLYFTQARDVRRLREQASFLVEGGNGDGEPVAPTERAATAVATKEPEQAAAAAAASAPNEAEAFRRAELARQAAERRQRFEQRRRRPNGGGRERPAWLSEPASLAAVVIGAIILVAGVAFGVTRITSGGSDSTTAAQDQAKKGPCPPGQTKVAVLNGTATPGLAASSAGQLRQAQYKVGPVGNTSTPFPVSVVMFDPSDGKECAPIVGQIVGVQKTQPMNNEVRQAAEGDPVAVVLGDDKAGASSGSGAASTTGSGI